jgi:hypothetical protein
MHRAHNCASCCMLCNYTCIHACVCMAACASRHLSSMRSRSPVAASQPSCVLSPLLPRRAARRAGPLVGDWVQRRDAPCPWRGVFVDGEQNPMVALRTAKVAGLLTCLGPNGPPALTTIPAAPFTRRPRSGCSDRGRGRRRAAAPRVAVRAALQQRAAAATQVNRRRPPVERAGAPGRELDTAGGMARAGGAAARDAGQQRRR